MDNVSQENTFDVDKFNALVTQLSIQKKNKFYQLFSILMPYLKLEDLVSCSLLNHAFHEKATAALWKEPNFKRLSHIHDEVYMFNKFISRLCQVRQSTASHVVKIDIASMEEDLYHRVDSNFFRVLVQSCSKGLCVLNLSKTSFFSQKSLPKAEWSLPYLTCLNLSYCSQVNDNVLVQIARGCRQLRQVRLDGLTRHKGNGLAGFAAECDQLESVSVQYNTALEDQAIVALAKFRHIRLLELDMTGCTKLTSTGFELLARYAAHLKYLSLAQTACHMQVLRKFTCIYQHTLSLDISLLKSCTRKELAGWISQSCFQKLVDLIMDTTTAIEIVKLSKDQLINTSAYQVVHLTLKQLPEHTPMTFLYQLIHLFSHLKHVKFTRAYFESDFLLGVYRTPSPTDEIYITDAEVERFNMKQDKVIVTVVREREDDINCNLLNW